MRLRAAFAVLSFLFPLIAAAQTAIQVSPSQINQFDAEVYLDITGVNLAGDVDTQVVFSGPAGTFTVGALDATSTDVIVSVPTEVAQNAGQYSVTIEAIDTTGTRTIGPGIFNVIATSTTQPPLLSIPEVVVAEATGPSGANVSFSATGFSFVDPPPAPAVSCDHPSGALFPLGTTTVTCSATDSFATTTGQFLVVVADTTPPVITVPASFVSASGTVTYSVSATDNLDGPVAVTCDPLSGSTFPVGITTVQCVAEDAHANVGHASFQVSVTPPPPPTLTLPGNFSVFANFPDGAQVTYEVSADEQASIVCNPPSGSKFPMGNTTVTCTATNQFGGQSTGSFVVTVFTFAPTLTLPADITAEATGPNGAAVTYTATATDGFDGTVPVTCTPLSGSTFPLGTTTVQCSATNSHGGTATGSFNVTVRDTTPPALTLPSNITAEATGPNGAAVTYTATATDLVDGSVTPTCTPASGSTFALGTTTVQCSATDAHHNTSTGSFTVTVVDTTPPQILDVKATPSTLWPPNHKMVDIAVAVTAVDLVDPNPTNQIVSVTSNQPVNGTGDGDTAPDWVITGPLTLQLRSERASGQDRVYTITVSSTDFSGNTSTSTVEVKVTQTKGRASH